MRALTFNILAFLAAPLPIAIAFTIVMRKSGPILSFAARLACACFGGPLVFFCLIVSGGFDNSNGPAWVVWAPLLIVWVVGTVWMLAGRAHEVSGWGELKVSEVVFFPLFTLTIIVGSFFMQLMLSLAGMH
jgi:hypothetical protein